MKKQRLREVYVAWQHWSVGKLDIRPKSAWIWGLALSHCAVCTPTPICVSPSIFTSASHDVPIVWIFKHPPIETVPPGKLERGYYPQATVKGGIKAQRGRATHTANPSSSEHPQDTVPHDCDCALPNGHGPSELASTSLCLIGRAIIRAGFFPTAFRLCVWVVPPEPY